MDTRSRYMALFLAASAGLAGTKVQAAAWVPTGAGAQNWNVNDTAHWDTGTFPNATSATATVSTALAGAQTITLGQDITLGSLNIGASSGTNAYTIATGNNLNFNSGGGTSTLTHVSTGQQDTINAPIVLNGDLNITSSSNNKQLDVLGGVTGTGNLTVTQSASKAINFSSGSVAVNNTGSITFTGAVNGNSFLGTIGKNVTGITINNTSGNDQAGVKIFGAADPLFAGNVTITAGRLTLQNAGALNANNLVTGTNFGAVVEISNSGPSGGGATIAGLSGFAKIVNNSSNSHTLTIGGSGTYSVNPAGGFDQNGGVGGLKIALTGSGVQTLSGNFPNGGALTVQSGTLNTSIAAFTTGGQLDITGGTLTPNGSSVGSITLGASKNFTESLGTLALTFASTSSYDQIKANATAGTFSITGGTIDLTNTVPDYTATYQVLSGFSSGSVSGLSFTNYDSANYTASLSNTGLLSFVTVPEPTSMGLLGLCALGMLGRRRK